MTQHNRRTFLCGCSAAIAAMAGSRMGSMAFGAPGTNNNALLVVFLRGGMDGVTLVPPIAGGDRGRYESFRPNIQVPTNGGNAAISIGSGFGLHPALQPLKGAWDSNDMAIVHAAGLTEDMTRSHFDAMEYMELGTPGNKSTGSGWLTRHMVTATNLPPTAILPAVAIGSTQPTSLLAYLGAVSMTSASSFDIDEGPWQYRDLSRSSLNQIYRRVNSAIHLSGQQALDALDIVQDNLSGGYTPANGSSSYYNSAGGFGENMQLIARLMKENLGLQVATVDLGGWDMHNGLGDNGGGGFSNLAGVLANGLGGLYRDLSGSGNPINRLTVVVMSEFGRRLRQNGDRGVDHGYGNRMLILGGRTQGGEFYGAWPGLRQEELFQGEDLDVTVDVRRVLSEIMMKRLGNNRIEAMFPGYSERYMNEGPLGLVENDYPGLPVDQSPFEGTGGGDQSSIFSDDFELASTFRWDSNVGG